jgi:hypothetical protein
MFSDRRWGDAMFWVCALLLFVGPPEVIDAAPELPVKVVGPTEPVPVGRLVKLTPEGPEGTDFGWGMPVGEFEVAQQANLPVLFYSAEQPGRVLFVLQAVKCNAAGQKPAKTLVFYWLDVVGGDGRPAPGPGPAPVAGLTDRVRRVFVVDGNVTEQAATDARAMQVSLTAVADLLEKERFGNAEELAASIDKALTANGWAKGRYPAMNGLFGEVLGTAVEVTAFTPEDRARYVTTLRAIATGAKLAADSFKPKGTK